MKTSVFRAGLRFLGTLFGRLDPEKGYSDNGHSILEGWNQAPEETVISKMRATDRRKAELAQIGLYATNGPHHGELFLLRGPSRTVGTTLTDDLVITPNGNQTQVAQPVVLQIGSMVRVMAPAGETVTVNGTKTDSATVFDFDEIEIFGNQFLFLDLEKLQWKR